MADLPNVSSGAIVLAIADEDTVPASPGSLRAAVTLAGQRWAAGQRRLVRLVAELDRSNEWTLDGARSCAHWVADAVDVEVCTAREWVRIGRDLTELDVIDQAFADGQLSYSKVRTLTRIANVETQEELCALAQQVPSGRLAHAIAVWLAGHETPVETEARHERARTFSTHTEYDGMVVGTFRLSPAAAEIITGPVNAIVRQGHVGARPRNASADAFSSAAARWPSLGQQRADALLEVISRGVQIRHEIVLHVRGDGCTLDDGTPVADSFVERIAPRAFLRALIHDADRRPINASGRQRHPTERQRRVVQARDRACVDCGSNEFLQYDHEPAYGQTMHTVVDELKLRCWACHRARHEGDDLPA